jgi:hypothetical protein
MIHNAFQGRIQDFKLGGAHLKKLRRAEGGAKNFGVFRVKNHDFTQKKIHIFSNFRGGGRTPDASPLDPPLPLISLKGRVLNAIFSLSKHSPDTTTPPPLHNSH